MNRERFATTATRRLLGLSLALVMGIPFLWPAGARAQGGGWEWQNPLPQGNHLQDVWGSSDSDVFAVGHPGIILHYDGATWSPMSSGTTETLWGVWGNSGGDVFAVGGPGTILHYDGATWGPMSSGITDSLYDVWGSNSNDVFAVGENGTILYYTAEPEWCHFAYLPLVLRNE